jgi:hypothetical protein
LVSYHEIGVKEFGLNWAALLNDLAETPVEPIQLHYMRIGLPRGTLAAHFPNAWSPELHELLAAVLKENRRYQSIRNPRLLKLYELRKAGSTWNCAEQLSKQTGGLTYQEMLDHANRANFRHALWQMGEAIVTLFEQVIARAPRLQQLPIDDGPPWSEITRKWRKR